MPNTLHRRYPLVDYKMSSGGTECPSFVAALKLLQQSNCGRANHVRQPIVATNI